jgi:hypothetical protein
MKSREEEEYFAHSRIRTPDRPTRSQVTAPTELPLLHNIGLYIMSDSCQCAQEPMHIYIYIYILFVTSLLDITNNMHCLISTVIVTERVCLIKYLLKDKTI